jgi:hypothetical protein
VASSLPSSIAAYLSILAAEPRTRHFLCKDTEKEVTLWKGGKPIYRLLVLVMRKRWGIILMDHK